VQVRTNGLDRYNKSNTLLEKEVNIVNDLHLQVVPVNESDIKKIKIKTTKW